MCPAARRARRQPFILIQNNKNCGWLDVQSPVSADLKVAGLGLTSVLNKVEHEREEWISKKIYESSYNLTQWLKKEIGIRVVATAEKIDKEPEVSRNNSCWEINWSYDIISNYFDSYDIVETEPYKKQVKLIELSESLITYHE